MHRWTSLEDVPADLGPTVATLGNFDGVHRGHRAILDTVTAAAGEPGGSGDAAPAATESTADQPTAARPTTPDTEPTAPEKDQP